MNITPTQDRVAVRPAKVETKSKGGIVLPGNKNKKENTGIVVAVGPGKYDSNGKIIPVGVKEGDKVIFCDQYEIEGLDVKFNGIILLDESDIRAIISEELC